MEKKTNKANIENFQIFEKICFIAKLQPMIKLEVIMPYLQILQKNAQPNRVFFHAEFISAIKTVQNPTILMKNAKKQKN